MSTLRWRKQNIYRSDIFKAVAVGPSRERGGRQTKGLGREEGEMMGCGLLTCAAGDDENVDGILNLEGVHVEIIYKNSVSISQKTQSVSIINTVRQNSERLLGK